MDVWSPSYDHSTCMVRVPQGSCSMTRYSYHLNSAGENGQTGGSANALIPATHGTNAHNGARTTADAMAHIKSANTKDKSKNNRPRSYISYTDHSVGTHRPHLERNSKL